MPVNNSFCCLFGEGPAAIIGAPPNFDLCSSIAGASQIRLASAFAHSSGWALIESAFAKSSAKPHLLTGLDFCQTEPKVLRAWLALTKERRAAARLYVGAAATFHPKVLIVSGRRQRFAIVGSANLSAGGFRDNVECSLYVTEKKLLDELENWFDAVFSDEDQTRALTSPDIKAYEPKYKKARKHMAAVRKGQREIRAKIGEEHQAELVRWRQAISAARRYFRSRDFKAWYPKPKKQGARRIRTALRYPTFNFTQDDWDDFYAEHDLGRLRQAQKAAAWRQHGRIQEGFRHLVDDDLPVEERLSAILDDDGQYRATGIGLNIVSKVLAIHKPKVWAVFNGPIKETLEAFGYKLPWGMRRSAKYLAFCQMMRKFMTESGAQDMLALDCFFYWYSEIREE
jgi:HKD family nuclease